MQETAQQLQDAQQIAAHVVRMLLEQNQQIPVFPMGDVPIDIVAKVYGKDENWVRAGIICGWLPIGRATRKGELVTRLDQMDSRFGRINYQVSPKKLWEDTGYIWNGKEEVKK